MDMKYHLLVIDDDNRLRRLLKKYLSENGFQISEAANANETKQLLQLFQFSLLIMDVMMPGQNGQDLTKELRQTGYDVPILMLTAMGDIDNRISGLEAGADDYLAKPFEPKELLLRINNILKRQRIEETPTEIYFGDCCYNPRNAQLTMNGEPVILTSAEQELLKIMVQKAGQTVTREELASLVGTDNERAVDVQITRLRKKIETDIKKPLCIQTVRGQGYILVLK
ncbi:MAG: response regulator [Alphaproteobacteria bacterium]|nr:response regulator [Alphaproteobacteria bacterium]